MAHPCEWCADLHLKCRAGIDCIYMARFREAQACARVACCKATNMPAQASLQERIVGLVLNDAGGKV